MEKFREVRKLTGEICRPLQVEDYVVQPVDDVSPPKWHMAHTTWFWEEFVLARHLPGYTRFHPRYSFLFNSYYDGIGKRVLRPQRGNMSRPGVEDIRKYRAYIDEHMEELFRRELAPEVHELIAIGLHHEQQHQELLYTDVKYILGHNPLFPPYRAGFRESDSRESSGFAEFPQGNYAVGFEGSGFSFDNEHGRHQVYLQPFAISKDLVTNGAYLAFMEAGGYSRPEYWHSDGWAWVQQEDAHAPLYWHFIDGRWYRYSLGGLERVNPDEPVTHVSYYEAAAYAAWSGTRLPTEFEWEVSSESFDWGQRWEHTNSAYLAYPGYRKPPGAVGEYNGKFMINQMVLRGASVVTSPGHSRKTYRNFFHPHLRWQFNGIRVCKRTDL